MNSKTPNRQRRMEIKTLNRKLSCIDAERKFHWKTARYESEHKELLNKQEENTRKKLEALGA